MSKAPKLRFKEFSGDWETQKAKELFESISDKNHNGDLEVLSATQDRGVIPRSELNIDIKYEQNNLTSYKKVKESDFIISLRSFQGGIEHSHYTGLVSPAYTVFNFKNNIDSNHRFFAEIFKTQNFINRLNTLTYGIRDGKAISFKDFSDVKLSFPSKEEQEKIASFFSLIDEKISLQGEKVEALKDYKRGMMQKIFSRELRFKDDEGRDYPEWEEKKLGDVGIIVTGNTPSTKEKDNYGDEYLWASPADLGYKKVIDDTINKLSFKGFDKIRKVPKGSILATCIGSTIGKIGMASMEMSTNQQINTLICNKDINNEFVYYSLEYNFPRYLSYVTAQAVPIINKTQFQEFDINVPVLDEQIKIGKTLSKIDLKIEKEQEKLDSLNQYKKGLLQQMFV